MLIGVQEVLCADMIPNTCSFYWRRDTLQGLNISRDLCEIEGANLKCNLFMDTPGT